MPVVCNIDVQRAAISSDAFFSQQLRRGQGRWRRWGGVGWGGGGRVQSCAPWVIDRREHHGGSRLLLRARDVVVDYLRVLLRLLRLLQTLELLHIELLRRTPTTKGEAAHIPAPAPSRHRRPCATVGGASGQLAHHFWRGRLERVLLRLLGRLPLLLDLVPVRIRHLAPVSTRPSLHRL